MWKAIRDMQHGCRELFPMWSAIINDEESVYVEGRIFSGGGKGVTFPRCSTSGTVVGVTERGELVGTKNLVVCGSKSVNVLFLVLVESPLPNT